jgi:hypothetical protein
MVDKLSVLRECFRVLKPGGRMAGYVIHTPDDLSPAARDRATELGPTYVTAPAAPGTLARQVGFEVLACRDVTAEFRATSVAFLRAMSEIEPELRAEEGDAYFEEERAAEEMTLTGIDEGLLLRSMVIAVKP